MGVFGHFCKRPSHIHASQTLALQTMHSLAEITFEIHMYIDLASGSLIKIYIPTNQCYPSVSEWKINLNRRRVTEYMAAVLHIAVWRFIFILFSLFCSRR